MNFSWYFLTRILSWSVLSCEFWEIEILDLSWIKIFDYLKVLNCLDSNMLVLSLSCLEFQDFVPVLNCLVLRNFCLDPSLIYVRASLYEFGLTQPLTTNWNSDLLSFSNFLLSLQLLAWRISCSNQFEPVQTRKKLEKLKLSFNWDKKTKSDLNKSWFWHKIEGSVDKE